MGIVFFITIVSVGIMTAAISFVDSEKMSKGIKIFLFAGIILCLIFQGWYGWNEKEATDRKDSKDNSFQNESLRGQDAIQCDIRELKEKEKKGLLTGADHSLYIARYLESIDHTLRFGDGRNTSEWVTLYYDEVEKIPSFFSLEDWKKAEKLIYTSIRDEISGYFAARNRTGPVRLKVIEVFNEERNRVVKSKEARQ